MNQEEKYARYAALISGAIGSIFEEGSEWAIDQDELEQDENFTLFFHALANVAPTYIFNQLTGENKNNLEFNHIANQLCFQYMKK